MEKAMKWLTITWPVLLIAGAIVIAGLFVMGNATGVFPLLGFAMVLFGLYWGYRGTVPERD